MLWDRDSINQILRRHLAERTCKSFCFLEFSVIYQIVSDYEISKEMNIDSSETCFLILF